MSGTLDKVRRVQPGGRSREVQAVFQGLHAPYSVLRTFENEQTHHLCAYYTNEMLFFADDRCSLCTHNIRIQCKTKYWGTLNITSK